MEEIVSKKIESAFATLVLDKLENNISKQIDSSIRRYFEGKLAFVWYIVASNDVFVLIMLLNSKWSSSSPMALIYSCLRVKELVLTIRVRNGLPPLLQL